MISEQDVEHTYPQGEAPRVEQPVKAPTKEEAEAEEIASYMSEMTSWEREIKISEQQIAAVKRGFTQGIASTLEGLGVIEGAVREGGPEKAALTRWGRAVGEFAQSAFPVVEDAPQDFWSKEVPETLGQAAEFLLPTGVGAKALSKAGMAVKWASRLSVGIHGAIVEGGGQYYAAKASGADEETAWKSWALGLGVGTTEAVGAYSRVLTRIMSTPAGPSIRAILTEGGEEFAQEVTQTVLGNLVARNMYDEEREILQDALHAGKLGGAAGMIMSALSMPFAGLGSQAEARANFDKVMEEAEKAAVESVQESEAEAAAPDKAEASSEQVQAWVDRFKALDPEGDASEIYAEGTDLGLTREEIEQIEVDLKDEADPTIPERFQPETQEAPEKPYRDEKGQFAGGKPDQPQKAVEEPTEAPEEVDPTFASRLKAGRLSRVPDLAEAQAMGDKVLDAVATEWGLEVERGDDGAITSESRTETEQALADLRKIVDEAAPGSRFGEFTDEEAAAVDQALTQEIVKEARAQILGEAAPSPRAKRLRDAKKALKERKKKDKGRFGRKPVKEAPSVEPPPETEFAGGLTRDEYREQEQAKGHSGPGKAFRVGSGVLGIVPYVQSLGGLRTNANIPETLDAYQAKDASGAEIKGGGLPRFKQTDKGVDLDGLLERLVEDGWFPGRTTGDLDFNDVIDLIDRNAVHPDYVEQAAAEEETAQIEKRPVETFQIPTGVAALLHLGKGGLPNQKVTKRAPRSTIVEGDLLEVIEAAERATAGKEKSKTFGKKKLDAARRWVLRQLKDPEIQHRFRSRPRPEQLRLDLQENVRRTGAPISFADIKEEVADEDLEARLEREAIQNEAEGDPKDLTDEDLFFDFHAGPSTPKAVREWFSDLWNSSWRKRLTKSDRNIGEPSHRAWIDSQAWVAQQLTKAKGVANDLEAAMREAYGKPTDAQWAKVNEALSVYRTDRTPFEALPVGVQPHVEALRAHIDALSNKLIMLGVVRGKMAIKISENLGHYLHRSYEKHSDPKWEETLLKRDGGEQIIKDLEVWIEANFQTRMEGKKEVPTTASERQGIRNAILSHQDSPFESISKLGSKSPWNKILAKRKTLPDVVLRAMGEEKHPLANYTKSIEKISFLAAQHQLQKAIWKAGWGKWLHPRPTGRHIVKLAPRGSSAFDVLTKTPTGRRTDVYTTAEIADAFNSFQVAARTRIDDSEFGLLMAPWIALSGWTRFGKTVLNPITHPRNFIANWSIMLSSGVNPFNPGEWARAWKMATSTKAGADAEFRAMYQEAVKYGVTFEGANAGELRAFATSMREAGVSSPMGYLHWTKSRSGKLLGKITSAYRLEDEMPKLVAWRSMTEQLKKAKPSWSDAKAKEEAARRIRDRFPTYILAPELAQQLRRFPGLAPFVIFPAEMFRSAKNTLKHIKADLKDPDLAPIAKRQIMGSLAAGLGPVATAAFLNFMGGISGDEADDLDEFALEWDRGDILLWRRNEEDPTRASYINFSYVDPYSYIRDPLMQLLAGEDVDPDEAVLSATKKALEPFGPDIFTEATWKALMDLRARLADEPEAKPSGEVLKKWFREVRPGFMHTMGKMEAAINERVWLGGIAPKLSHEVLAQASGFRRMDIDVHQRLQDSTADYESRRSNQIQQLSNKASRIGYVSEDEVAGHYRDMVTAQKRNYDRMLATINSARALGIGERDIYRSLTDAGRMSKARAKGLLRGRFEPYSPSDRFLDTAMDRARGAEQRSKVRARKRIIKIEARKAAAEYR